MLINSVVAFLVPVSAKSGGYWWLLVVRFIQGLGEVSKHSKKKKEKKNTLLPIDASGTNAWI